MVISSRTPEGQPARCPLCQAEVRIEPALFYGDAPCPNCGSLLWFLQNRHEQVLFEAASSQPVRERFLDIVAEQLGVHRNQINEGTSFVDDLGADSLDMVELVMELEEEFGE